MAGQTTSQGLIGTLWSVGKVQVATFLLPDFVTNSVITYTAKEHKLSCGRADIDLVSVLLATVTCYC